MAHIKQAGLFPGPFVALNVAEIGVLEGHGEAREGDHFGTPSNMEVIELCLSQITCRR